MMACDRKHPDLTFYYWRTTWDDTGKVGEYLTHAEAPLYLRFFDIDRPNGQAEAIFRGGLIARSALPADFVPTLFITNRTFVDPDSTMMATLPQQVYAGLQQRGWKGKGEVQFDCDWSADSRAHFFRFLDDFRALAGDSVTLSATIRLHQVKFSNQTGIPPVDHGTLMFYNMGEVRNPNSVNSILDLELGEAYLKTLPHYPLDLDVALPIFGWAVLQRWGKVVNLLPEVTPEDLQADSLLEKSDPDHAKVLQSHYFSGEYVYAGDELRLEYITPEMLEKAARIVAKHAPEKGFRRLLYYHLSETTAQKFPIDELEENCRILP